MARTNQVRRERIRLRRVLPCLGKDFVLIPVLVPDPPFDWRQAKGLRDALLAAGAVEVVHGRVSEPILQAALTDEIRIGHLPEDARKLAAQIEDITVFCHVCAEDIRCVLKVIKDGIANCQPLQVEHLFIDYRCFKKDILHLGIHSFQCSSPRHPRHVKAHVVESSDHTVLIAHNADHTEVVSDSSDLTELVADGADLNEVVASYSSALTQTNNEPFFGWANLDEGISHHYMLDTDLTGLSETSFQDLMCAVYRLFVNKDYLFDKFRKGDLEHCSPFISVLLKLLGGLMRILSSYLCQPEDDPEIAILPKLLSFQKNMDIVLTRLSELDPDGSCRLFMSNIGLDWAAILEAIVLSSLELQNSLQSIVSQLIDGDREGLEIDRKLLKDSIETLKTSSLYETVVEVPYLRSVATYFTDLSKRRIRILGIGEYVKEVETSMDREVRLVREFMDPKVETKIISLIVKEMVGDHIKRLVLAPDSHLSQLIDDASYGDINRLCRLVCILSDGSAFLCTALTYYVKKTLSVLIADKEKEPTEYVQLILDERQKFERIIKQCLGRDMRLASKFSFVLRELSGENLHLPEYVSLFINHMLVQKVFDQQAVDNALEKALVLVGDFDDKFVFQIYYQKHLADRLLSGTYSEEIECKLILKLRLYCCPHYLDRLKTMVHDISYSKLLMRKFFEINVTAHDDMSICVRVLRSGFWPKQPATTCKLPCEIIQKWEMFCDFYLSQHAERKLSWCPTLGNTILTAEFGDGREYEFSLPVYHMCVLMLFNSTNSLTFGEIQYKTCIPRAELKKCLFSLTCMEGQNILSKEPNGEITRNDRFYVNDHFYSKLDKVTFTAALKNARLILDEDATNCLDSVIIKMLKQESAGLTFNGLVKMLAAFLKTRFRITPRVVQRRLITLVLWEVIRKEDRDGKIYYIYYMY